MNNEKEIKVTEPDLIEPKPCSHDQRIKKILAGCDWRVIPTEHRLYGAY
jgi:hypothetical protein